MSADSSSLSIARASYREIPLYSAPAEPCELDVSDNTNLYGVPPSALRALSEPPSAAVTRYPAQYALELKAAIADYVGARPEQIVTGCGSDDVLDSAIRAFAEPGDRIAHSAPTFAMIPIFARLNGLTPVPVPLKKDWDADVDGLLAAKARIIYLCSPNNPTGTVISPEAIARIVREAPGLVILDEAYIEFAREDLKVQLSGERVLVTRTLSKAFGLAGLRIGYAVGAPAVVAEVEKSRGPYKINSLAERAAVAALRNDLAWVRERAEDVRRNRARLTEALKGLGLSPLPSAANFVLVPVPDAARIGQRMREKGVAVRAFVNLAGVGDALRIGLGPWEILEKVLSRLAEVLR